MRRSLLLLLALVVPASAVGIRVATFNVGAYFTESSGGVYYPLYGLGAAGTPDHESVKNVLARIDADIVALQEIDSADSDGSPNDVDDLAESLGYPYVFIAPANGSGGLVAPFDSDLRVAFLSRHPFISAAAIRSPAGAKELTRLHAAVKVDVPGTTRDPVIITGHLKPGGSSDERFRRAVEMKRLVGHLAALGLSNDDNFILTGDFNLNPNYASTTFSSLPSDLPESFVLGSDYTLPLDYSIDPLDYFNSPGAARLDPRQLDGSAVTYPGGAGYTLDLLLVSPALAGRPLATEIYNSALDVSNGAGLPKAGAPLASATSATASDHYAVFADLELDSDLPDLALALSAPSLAEGLPDGTVTLTVTLPAVRAVPVTVMLSSDDPDAVPAVSGIVIPAGSLGGNAAVRAPRNFIADPPRTVTFTAAASGYDESSSSLQVLDADGPYVIAAAGLAVVESFDGFGGNHDPAPWTTTGGWAWRGMDDGSTSARGFRSYGTGGDGSLGFLAGGAVSTASAAFVNQSGKTLTGLQMAFDVEQWRSAAGGAADSLGAELLFDGQAFPLPGLSHVAGQSLPDGPVAGGLTTAKSAWISGLSIPPGAAFELRITVTPGAPPQPADVFINEFHYDNIGSDSNEFIEIAVAPGFGGGPEDIDVVFYNGATAGAAVPYATHNLAAFTAGDTSGGYRLYHLSLPQDGIQNGDRDGFAVVHKPGGQVLQLISYEGTFTAGTGPAAGMTSTSIPVSQNNSTTAEGSSLGLAGTGGVPGDFTWTAFPGGNTKGSPNAGQSFVSPGLPSQGFAIDNLAVTAVADPDADGDNDGQSDADEIAFGTDPQDPASVFRPAINRNAGLSLSLPGAAGIAYTVEWSDDLDEWHELSSHAGAGETIVVPLPEAGPATFFRVRAGE